MAPTKHVVNWGYRHAGGHLTNDAEMVSADVFGPGRHYRRQLPINDVVVIGDHSDIDFKSPLGQFGLFVFDKDNVDEYLGATTPGARYDELNGGLAGARGGGVWNVNPEPGHAEYSPYSSSQTRMANRLGYGRVVSKDRVKEFVRRNARVNAKDGIYISWAIDEFAPGWKGTGIWKLPGHVVSDIELQETYQFALGNVIVDYPVAPEPELSPFIAITQVVLQPAAHELTISRREPLSDTHQSLTEDGNRVVREREKLLVELANAFDAMPFEDGIAHPAEKIIERALGKEDSFNWLLELVHESTHQSIVPSVLRCLGRMVDVGTEEWRVNLITNALASTEAEIRDAAVQVVESWAGKDLLTVLESHNETVPWIRDYINDVLADLGV